MGWAGCDNDRLAGERLGRIIEHGLDPGDNLERFGHAAGARLAALGHLAGVRADKGDAVGLKRVRVAPGGGMVPHERVHGGGDQHRLVGRQQHGGGEVIGEAMGHLGHEIGGGGRHHNKVGLARQANVADIVLGGAVPQVAEDGVAGNGADAHRCDELLGRLTHDAAHRRAALTQAADQVEAFIGRNPSADDEKDALAENCFCVCAHDITSSAEVISVWTKSSPLNSKGTLRVLASA